MLITRIVLTNFLGQMYNLQLTTVGDVTHTVDAPLTIDIIGSASSFITELDAPTYPAFQ